MELTYLQPINEEIISREEALERAIKVWMNGHYRHWTGDYRQDWWLFEEALKWGE